MQWLKQLQQLQIAIPSICTTVISGFFIILKKKKKSYLTKTLCVHETGQKRKKAILALWYLLDDYYSFFFLLSSAAAMLFLKCLLMIPCATSMLSNRVMPGNCASATVKTAGTTVSSNKVLENIWNQGIPHKYLARLSSFLTRILCCSWNVFIATFLDLANLPPAQDQNKQKSEDNSSFLNWKTLKGFVFPCCTGRSIPTSVSFVAKPHIADVRLRGGWCMETQSQEGV